MGKNEGPGLLLDTHIWLRYQGISGDLLPAALPRIHAAVAHGKLYISVISIWETAMLARAGKLSLNTNINSWTQQALSKPGLNLLDFSPEIAIESVNLPEPVHKDPADRILIASARVERLTLVTRDQKVLEFASRNHMAHLVA